MAILLAMLALLASSAAAQNNEPLLRVAYMPDSKLIHKVEPIYPARAFERRIQGDVRFAIIIAKDGTIEQLRLLSGHPLLAPAAARNAVRQWRYEPTPLNGNPMRVSTRAEIRFQWAPRRSPPNAI